MASSSDPAHSPADATALIQSLAKASGYLDKPDARLVPLVCEVGKAVLLDRATSMVKESPGWPLLTCKSADGTPVKARTRHKWGAGADAVRRAGYEGLEVLVKNQFVRKRPGHGGAETSVMLQEPIALEYGKSCHAIFQGCIKDWRSLRQWGHDGIAIEFYCFDRFGIGAHERILRQWHGTQQPHPCEH